MDWNNDSDFNDAGENVLSTGYLSTPASLGTITIPPGQPVGSYRMRIRNAYLSSPAPACGSFDYGEAEDYTIQVVAPAACSGTPSAGTVTTNPTSGNTQAQTTRFLPQVLHQLLDLLFNGNIAQTEDLLGLTLAQLPALIQIILQ